MSPTKSNVVFSSNDTWGSDSPQLHRSDSERADAAHINGSGRKCHAPSTAQHSECDCSPPLVEHDNSVRLHGRHDVTHANQSDAVRLKMPGWVGAG